MTGATNPARTALTIWLTVALAAALAISAVQAAPASAGGPCTSDGGEGGDWPYMNGDLLAQNNQRAEELIGVDNAGQLEAAWITPPSVDTGRSVPVVSGRCVYVTGASADRGRVTALDLETGTVVWRSEAFMASNYEPFSLAVRDGRVHLQYDNDLRPHAAALDADTGQTLWRSEEITFGYEAWMLSNPMVFEMPFGDDTVALHLMFTTGPDFDPAARPGYAILDATTGETLVSHVTVPEEDYAEGYSGGGVWGTPAIDTETGYAFVGTANPYSKTKEHRYDNAIIKLDVDPNRSTFGQIVDSYKGTPDNVAGEVLYDQPACALLGPSQSAFALVGCFQTDVDFGNGPTMWRNADGELMLAELQKDGTLHGVRADTMEATWTSLIGTNSTLTLTGGNHGYAATDGARVYVQANPGVVHAVDGATGAVVWSNPIANAIPSQPVNVTNGVVYTVDWQGMTFWAWAADDGRLLLRQSIQELAGRTCGGETAGGVVIAHHDVVVHCQGVLVNFRVPGI